MAALQTLEDAFVHELQDLLHAEQQVLKSWPKMAKKASHPELRQVFESHVQQTERQVERLNRAFDSIGRTSKTERCAGMAGILKEGETIMGKRADPQVMDAELIAAAQKVEHYEIASYGTICQWAEQLGYQEAHELLGQNLAEEKETDQKLTSLAKQQVNIKARQPFEMGDEEYGEVDG